MKMETPEAPLLAPSLTPNPSSIADIYLDMNKRYVKKEVATTTVSILRKIGFDDKNAQIIVEEMADLVNKIG